LRLAVGIALKYRYKYPVINIFSDSQISIFGIRDRILNWNDHLTLLKKKGWFKVALKYALAIQINDREALDVLTAFTGNPETVLKVYTAEALRKVIKVIAVTASKVKSSSSQVQNNKVLSTNEAAQVEINKGLEEVEDIEW
jgi:hypothetical protein